MTDQAGQRVDLGNVQVPPGHSDELQVGLKALPPGTYKVSWHVVSVDTHPTEGSFTFQVGGGNLTLSWPSDHLGWTLQSNAIDLGNTSDWFDYPPDTGSRNVNQAVIPLSSANTNVFFRLKLPQ